MRLTIEAKDCSTLVEALHAQLRFWFTSRNKTAQNLRAYARQEVRAAVRLLRAVRGAK